MKHTRNILRYPEEEEDTEATLELLIGRDPGLDYLNPRPLDEKPPLDQDIAIMSGTAEDVPPNNIVYTNYFLEKKMGEFDVCHYFDADEHVYSIRHDKRKRAKYTEIKEVHSPPSQHLPHRESQMYDVYRKYIEPRIVNVRRSFPLNVPDSRLHQMYECRIPYNTADFTYLQHSMFPCVSVKELQNATMFGYKTAHNPVPVKDIIWIAHGGSIPEKLNVYPLCGNSNCCKKTHFRLLSENDWLIKKGCRGDVICTYNNSYKIMFPCTCAVTCKKVYFQLCSRESIITPDNPELPYQPPARPSMDDTFDRNSTIVAMRFKVEEAKDLLDLCDDIWVDVERELDWTSTIESPEQKEIREKIMTWRKCRTLSETSTKVYRQKSGGRIESAYLKIPQEHCLYKIATKVKVKDLVWRAHGHSIGDKGKVYNTCLDSNCDRYEHLSEESHETFLSRQSCSTKLCLEDDRVNSVIPCVHDIKCTAIRVNSLNK
jgi:hypothetical protein